MELRSWLPWIGAGATVIGLVASGWAVARDVGSGDTKTEMRLDDVEREQVKLVDLPTKLIVLEVNQKNQQTRLDELRAAVDANGRDLKEVLKAQGRAK